MPIGSVQTGLKLYLDRPIEAQFKSTQGQQANHLEQRRILVDRPHHRIYIIIVSPEYCPLFSMRPNIYISLVSDYNRLY